MPEAGSDGSVFDSVRRLGASYGSLIRARLGIFSVELQEEKARVAGLLVRTVVALAVLAAGILLVIIVLALAAWRLLGFAGLLILAVLTLGVALALILDLRKRMLNGPAPFAGTIAEFEKDCECLKRD